MSWHLGRLCGFDLETTGVSTEDDRIVTACVVQCGGGHPTASANWLADPGVEIPEGAAKVHGITTEQARAKGRPAAEVVEQVTAALAQVQRDGIPIVAMNASFDLTMLDREARRHGITPLVDVIGADKLRVIDPRVLDKQVSRRKGSRTLTDLCSHYGVRLDGAHASDADAIAACRVVWRIGQQHPKLAGLALEDLHEQQVQWAGAQARSLRAYFARTPGKESWADGVREDWPLVPRQAEAGER
ncbi:3'-5' exonuclease [Streptomyces sp. DSM 41524]|uniref:3'-5' exonuclease n=1 Tax=Streptomyces asiaticus subsp. ignotus TaxID=3098222 RepID=A0ABU7QA47_9ACTN|nr:3'-5' exonuclease [Streptomyces sp. DSM 41524]